MTDPQYPYGDGQGQHPVDPGPYDPRFGYPPGPPVVGPYPPGGPASYPPVNPYGPYPPQLPYPYPYGPGYPQTAGTNGMAIASMVLGILWIYWVGSILALIFGYVALSQIRQRRQQGYGMAIAGIVLGWVGVATAIIVIIAVASASDATVY